ncbi:MAG: Fur family transcriptional regulator [Thermoguttaceae bacterium]
MFTALQISDKINKLRSQFAEKNLVLTDQRKVVYESLLETDSHPTADLLFEQIRKKSPQISRMSVFRTLDLLVELGFVRQLEHPGSAARYDADTGKHYHLVCKKCHAVLDVSAHELGVPDIPLPQCETNGFTVSEASVIFLGMCGNCRT